jgi:hypothetical protein
MVLIQFTTSNPDGSWIIGKNPASPPLIKSIRQGYGIGYYNKYSTTPQYCILFRDASGCSYGGSESYLNPSQYFSSLCVRNLINEFLSTPLTQNREKGVMDFMA